MSKKAKNLLGVEDYSAFYAQKWNSTLFFDGSVSFFMHFNFQEGNIEAAKNMKPEKISCENTGT